jgi:hypothetical protein
MWAALFFVGKIWFLHFWEVMGLGLGALALDICPGGAASCSQGLQSLGKCRNPNQSPEGAASSIAREYAALSGLMFSSSTFSRG